MGISGRRIYEYRRNNAFNPYQEIVPTLQRGNAA
jgi:hypothetical protein